MYTILLHPMKLNINSCAALVGMWSKRTQTKTYPKIKSKHTQKISQNIPKLKLPNLFREFILLDIYMTMFQFKLKDVAFNQYPI